MSTSNFEQSIYTIKNKLYPIYPNPASEFVKIGYNLNESTNINMYISDQRGALVQGIYRDKRHLSGLHSLDVNLSAIPDGFYILVLEVGEEVLTQKLIIKS